MYIKAWDDNSDFVYDREVINPNDYKKFLAEAVLSYKKDMHKMHTEGMTWVMSSLDSAKSFVIQDQPGLDNESVHSQALVISKQRARRAGYFMYSAYLRISVGSEVEALKQLGVELESTFLVPIEGKEPGLIPSEWMRLTSLSLQDHI